MTLSKHAAISLSSVACLLLTGIGDFSFLVFQELFCYWTPYTRVSSWSITGVSVFWTALVACTESYVLVLFTRIFG